MEKLELFQVKVRNDQQQQGFMNMSEVLESRYPDLITEVIRASGAPNEAVASSIFMRRFGFFITAQLYLLAHGKMWSGPLPEIYLENNEGNIGFIIDERFIRDRREGDLEDVVKNYALPVVEKFRKAGNISKIILWENLWGYIIWMYGMLDSDQAKMDVAELLEDELWMPEMKRSFFRQFLKNRNFEEAKADYKRITCCLNKELPNTGKCPYCPLHK